MITIECQGVLLKDIELIIFDKDGTLTDSHLFWLEIIRRRAKSICSYYQLDKTMYSTLQESMGSDLKNNILSPRGPVAIEGRYKVISSVIKTLSKNNINVEEDLISSLFKEVHYEFRKDAHKFIKPIHSAINFIKCLPTNKLKLALITSDSSRNANIALENINLKESFDLILGGDSNLGSKKSGDPAKFACKELKISPSHAISIGDAEMDHLMASNSDLLANILVATGQIPLTKLREISPLSVNSLDDINLIT